MSELRYQEALDFIYSFIDFSRERSDRYSPEAFELERTRRFLSRLDDPHQRYRSVHIAGTKGKGSVAAIVASCLQAAGYRTGLYTSPHLVDFCERIQIDGLPIEGESLAVLVDEVKPIVKLEPEITTYELMTALAFLHFAQREIDIGVFEVGLGGRLDSTNVIDPLVSVITSISYDHTHLLGETLEEIAGEKGGIIKAGVPVVIAPQSRSVTEVLRRIAKKRGSHLVRAEQQWSATTIGSSTEGQRIILRPAAARGDGKVAIEPIELWLPLLGRHQVENATVAYATIQELRRQGVELHPESVQEGYRSVEWPGRFQLMTPSPALIVDAAHNADSARRLRQALADYYPESPMTLVFGASSDKDIEGMLSELAPVAERIVFTQAVHPRAARPEELLTIAKSLGTPAEAQVPVKEAVEGALETAPENGVIVVTGSLFVVGEVLAAWHLDRQTLPVHPAGGEPI